jgi:hypothetical protein
MRTFNPNTMRRPMEVIAKDQLETVLKNLVLPPEPKGPPPATERQLEVLAEDVERALAAQAHTLKALLKAADKPVPAPVTPERGPTSVSMHFERDALGRIKSPVTFTINR